MRCENLEHGLVRGIDRAVLLRDADVEADLKTVAQVDIRLMVWIVVFQAGDGTYALSPPMTSTETKSLSWKRSTLGSNTHRS
jgi:hypothetical protein